MGQNNLETKTLAQEARELTHALTDLQSQIDHASAEGQDPSQFQELLIQCEADIERHHGRLQSKAEDVKTMFTRRDGEGDTITKIRCIKNILQDDATILFVHILKDEDALMRMYAAIALHGTQDPMCLTSLCEFGLKDDDALVRHVSAQSLAGTNDPACREALADLAQNDPIDSVREEAERALQSFTGTKRS